MQVSEGNILGEISVGTYQSKNEVREFLLKLEALMLEYTVVKLNIRSRLRGER